MLYTGTGQEHMQDDRGKQESEEQLMGQPHSFEKCFLDN